MKKCKFNPGFSLIEAIVVIGISGLTLTAITATLTYSIKSNAEARYRSLASSAANQAMELFVKTRVLSDWTTFKTFSGKNYCLHSLPSLTEGNCSSYSDLGLNAGITFKRTAAVTGTDPVNVKIKVTWQPNDTSSPSAPCEKQCVEVERNFYQYE